MYIRKSEMRHLLGDSKPTIPCFVISILNVNYGEIQFLSYRNIAITHIANSIALHCIPRKLNQEQFM